MAVFRSPADDTLWLVQHNGRVQLARTEQDAFDTAAESIAEWASHWPDVGSRLSVDWWTERALADLDIIELEAPN